MIGWPSSASPYWIGMINPMRNADAFRSLRNQVSNSPAATMRPAGGKKNPLMAMAPKFSGSSLRTRSLSPAISGPPARTGRQRKTARSTSRMTQFNDRLRRSWNPVLAYRPGTAFGASAIGLLGAASYADFCPSDLDVFAKARRRPLGDESTTWMLCLASCHTYYSRNSGLATVRSQANFE